MFLYIPLLFFCYSFIYAYKRNGFDISCCIFLMYAITSFFGVLLGNTDYQFEYENYSKIEIDFIPTFVYCSMIGLCVYPYFKFKSNSHIHLERIRNIGLFKLIANIYICIFFSLLIVYSSMIVFILSFGDYDVLRQMTYEGILKDPIYNLSGVIRIYASLCSILGEGGYFMIVFFFYSVCALNNKGWYNFLILASSLSPALMGFVNIDRSKMAFWFLLFIFAYIMFKPHIINEKQKKIIKRISFVFLGLVALYLVTVTIARFGQRDEGASGGLLVYLGQPFLNFCKIWEKYWVDSVNTARVLPITNFILGNGSLTPEYVDSVFQRYNVHINVFTSFVGVFLIDIGHLAAIGIPVLIFLVTSKFLKKYNCSSYLTLRMAIIIFGLGAIVQCGIIAYYYETVGRVLTLLIFLIVSKKFGMSSESYFK